jgi:predicted transcriptional regulator
VFGHVNVIMVANVQTHSPKKVTTRPREIRLAKIQIYIRGKKSTYLLESSILMSPDIYKMPNIILILYSAHAKQFLVGESKLNLVQ